MGHWHHHESTAQWASSVSLYAQGSAGILITPRRGAKTVPHREAKVEIKASNRRRPSQNERKADTRPERNSPPPGPKATRAREEESPGPAAKRVRGPSEQEKEQEERNAAAVRAEENRLTRLAALDSMQGSSSAREPARSAIAREPNVHRKGPSDSGWGQRAQSGKPVDSRSAPSPWDDPVSTPRPSPSPSGTPGPDSRFRPNGNYLKQSSLGKSLKADQSAAAAPWGEVEAPRGTAIDAVARWVKEDVPQAVTPIVEEPSLKLPEAVDDSIVSRAKPTLLDRLAPVGPRSHSLQDRLSGKHLMLSHEAHPDLPLGPSESSETSSRKRPSKSRRDSENVGMLCFCFVRVSNSVD